LDKRSERPEREARATRSASGKAAGKTAKERVAEVRDFFRLTAQEWAARNPQAVEGLGDPGGAFRQARKQRQDEVRRLVAEIVASGEGEAVQTLEALIRDAPMEVLVPACEELVELRHGAAVPLVVREFRGSAPEVKQAILRLVAEVGEAEAYQIVKEGLHDDHEAVRKEAGRASAALRARDEALRTALALASGQRADAILGEPENDHLARDLALRLSSDLSLDEGLAALEALRSGGEGVKGRGSRTLSTEAVIGQLLEFVRPERGGKAGEGPTVPKPGSQRALLLLAAATVDLPDWALSQTAQAVIVRASAEDRSTVLRKAPADAAIRLHREALGSKSRQSIARGLSHLAQDRPDLVEVLSEELETLAFGVDLEHSIEAATLLLAARPEHSQAPALSRRLALLLSLHAAEEEAGAENAVNTRAYEALLRAPSGRKELAWMWLVPCGDSAVSPVVKPSLAVLQTSGKAERKAFIGELCQALTESPVALPPVVQDWMVGELSALDEADVSALGTRLARGLARLCVGPPNDEAVGIGIGTDSSADQEPTILERLAELLRKRPAVRESLELALVDELVGTRTREIKTLIGPLADAPDSALDLMRRALERSVTLTRSLFDHLGALYASDPETVRQWLRSSGREATLRPFLEACRELERNELLKAAERYLDEDRAERESLNDSINDLLDRLEERISAHNAAGPLGAGRASAASEIGVTDRLTGDTPPGEDAAALETYVGELAEALFAVLNSPPPNLPEAPAPTGDQLHDYHQVRLTRLAALNLMQQRSATLRSSLAAQGALPVEKLLVTLGGGPGRDDIAALLLLASWFSDLGLGLLEPELGVTVRFRSGRHVARAPTTPGEPVEVITWGFVGPDGSVVRKALVARAE